MAANEIDPEAGSDELFEMGAGRSVEDVAPCPSCGSTGAPIGGCQHLAHIEVREPGAVRGPDPAEQLAALFHRTYEALAPSHGYETREASAKPWADVPEPNRSLMITIAGRVLAEWPTIAAGPDVDAGGAGLDLLDELMADGRPLKQALRDAIGYAFPLSLYASPAVGAGGARTQLTADHAMTVVWPLVERLIRERDEARANAPEGGAWSVEYGHDLNDHGFPTWWNTIPCPQGCNTQRRVWRGPVEPVTDDGSTT